MLRTQLCIGQGPHSFIGQVPKKGAAHKEFNYKLDMIEHQNNHLLLVKGFGKYVENWVMVYTQISTMDRTNVVWIEKKGGSPTSDGSHISSVYIGYVW